MSYITIQKPLIIFIISVCLFLFCHAEHNSVHIFCVKSFEMSHAGNTVLQKCYVLLVIILRKEKTQFINLNDTRTTAACNTCLETDVDILIEAKEWEDEYSSNAGKIKLYENIWSSCGLTHSFLIIVYIS